MMTRRRTEFEHLSDRMKAFCAGIRKKYRLGAHHLPLLVAAGESHDRMTQARDLLAAEGLIVQDRHGQPRPHPAVAIERDAVIRFARLLRELALEDEISADSRPPRLPGRRYGRN
jgi:Phage terminase, small subunit